MKTRRLLTTAAAALTLLAVPLAGPALAHVTVQGPGATQGGYSKLTFRVPTEKDVPTTKLEVAFPADAPLASVSVKPHAGWTYAITKGAPAVPFSANGAPVTSVVQRITWTATAGGIKPGEFDEFDVSAGPLATVPTLTFKALQTYSDGTVVRWIETRTPGGAEPEHPAPSVTLAAAAGTGTASASASPGTAAAVDQTRDVADSSDDHAGRGLSVAALVVALLALLTGAYAAFRSRATRT